MYFPVALTIQGVRLNQSIVIGCSLSPSDFESIRCSFQNTLNSSELEIRRPLGASITSLGRGVLSMKGNSRLTDVSICWELFADGSIFEKFSLLRRHPNHKSADLNDSMKTESLIFRPLGNSSWANVQAVILADCTNDRNSFLRNASAILSAAIGGVIALT